MIGKLRRGGVIPAGVCPLPTITSRDPITTHMKHIVFWIIIILLAAWIGLYI